MKSKIFKINGDLVGTTKEGNFFKKHSDSMMNAAFLDSEPQHALRLHIENLILTYGEDLVQSMFSNVQRDFVKKEAA